ncbi:TEX14 kinase, partial [Galbula dea]|nr:TEX14 kinase [Galbula dea]
GIFVDAVNSTGQTPLFIAALLGLGKIVDVLLDYGSDVNHRCSDGSTPVHAAAFSGNQWILSRLLDAGGDLRVHDEEGRNPRCWAMSAVKERSAQMLEFIQRCTFHMQAAIQNFPSDLLREVGSSKALVHCPSRFGGLVQGNGDSPGGRFVKGGAHAAKNIYSFGFGKFCLAGSGHLGYLASLPIIGEKDVVRADDEPLFSYSVGPYMIMTNLMWGRSRVTVKELSFEPHQKCRKLRLADLLVAEQEHCSKLHHPHLLQLMSVCLSSDLEKTRLVYERVQFSSLYSILHERRAEFPLLQEETVLRVLLQISDALSFLHSRGFLHRSLTSYAVQIVSSGEAKLCNLEYMVESKDGGEHSDLTRIPVPAQLHRWCSPEVILEEVVTVRSDIYSFCAVVQEALTETPPWNGLEDSVIKQLFILGQQLEADVRLPVPYYYIIKSGLEPSHKRRSLNLQDIQYILKKDIKDLTKSQTGHAGGMSKAQRCTVSAGVNISLASYFRYQKRTQELQGKQRSEADSSTAPRASLFPKESSALVDQEASSSLQPVAESRSGDTASEVQPNLSVSDVDESLCSFEINEMFASCSELEEDFLEEGARLGQAPKDEKRHQKEEDPHASPGVHCEEKPGYEEGGYSELSTEYASEEEERMSEASEQCMLAQVSRDAGRRGSSLLQNEQYISKCVLDLKIIQSFLQQTADSLCKITEKLDKLEASQKPKKKTGVNQFSKDIGQERHWNSSEDASQNTNSPFSEVNAFCWKAIGPPSGDYVPPLVTCQAQGALVGDSFQAVSQTAKEIEAIPREKWQCFHEMSKDENENHHDLSLRVVKSLDDPINLKHEVSVRCQKKFNLQCQGGGDSDSASSGSEEERWSCAKSRSEIPSTKISQERRRMQAEWRLEVKELARRVASGQLELDFPYSASEYTSESEAESIKEAFQHVTCRVQKSQGQQRCRWQTGGSFEPWELGSEHRSEPEERGLESVLRSSRGGKCLSPSQDEQAESGITIHKKSVLPQQAMTLSRGPSRELQCSLNSSSEVSEEFLTPGYFLPPTTQGSSELKVKITLKKGVEPVWRALDVMLDSLPSTEGAELPRSKCKDLALSLEAAQEVIVWEPQEECKEKDVSITDIQDFSSIPCEQEDCCKDGRCRVARGSHGPGSVSTPLSSEEKISRAFEKYKHYHEIASDSSFCGAEEISTVCRTFTTACEEERCTEIPLDASGVCSSELKEPVSLESYLMAAVLCLNNSLSQASNHFIEELPPPAQELLDEIEYLKQQDCISQDMKEEELHGSGVQRNVPEERKMEEGEAEKEAERNEERNHSSWTKESFTLAEETERAHSTLDDVLERMLRAVPADEESQEQ